MWNYEKRLQYPINITRPNAKIAQIVISQYGGPDGEMGASMRYLSQRYSMSNRKVAGLLTDIATEELAHPCWKQLNKLNFQSKDIFDVSTYTGFRCHFIVIGYFLDAGA